MKPKAQEKKRKEKKKKETHISPAVVEENKSCSSKLSQDQQDEKQGVLFSIKEIKRSTTNNDRFTDIYKWIRKAKRGWDGYTR